MDLLADDCAAVLEFLGVQQPVIVCGLSMGGYISFAFIKHYPNLVSGLILAATRAGADTDQGKSNRDKAAAQTEQYGTQPVIENMLPILLAPSTYQEKPELVHQVSDIMAQTSTSGMVSALLGMKSRPDATETLGHIKIPTLIIHGEEDQIISIRDSEGMQTAIPDSHLVVIPAAGHLPNLEQPEIFNRAANNFITSF